jgi:hypothetical protein
MAGGFAAATDLYYHAISINGDDDFYHEEHRQKITVPRVEIKKLSCDIEENGRGDP